MRALAVSMLTLTACAFTPSGLGSTDGDAATEDAAPDGTVAAIDAADPDAPGTPIDAPGPTIDAPGPTIDAPPPIDAPTTDPFCTDTGLDACFRMDHSSGAPVDGHTPPLSLARADGAAYATSCANHGNALATGAGVFVRTDEPPGNTGRLTVEAWVKLNAPLPIDGQRRFWFDADNEWGLSYIVTGANSVLVQCLVVQTTGGIPVATATIANATGWNHVACSFNADRLRLFINGNRTETNASNDPMIDVASGVQIGRDAPDAAGDVDGLIDDVRLWSRPVPDGELMAHAAAGCQ